MSHKGVWACVCECVLCAFVSALLIYQMYLSHTKFTLWTHTSPSRWEKRWLFSQAFILNSQWLLISFSFFFPFNLRWHFTSDICYYVYCFKHIFIMALIWCIFSNTDPTGVFCFSFHCHVSSSDLTLAASLLWDLKLWDLPQLNYVLFTYRHGNTYIWCSEHSKLYTVRCQASESNFLSHFMWSRFSAAHTV